MQKYYVYALIDPRDNKYFYIGKGKGNRYKQHLKENISNLHNIAKYSRIKEIQNENLKVKIEILFPNLSETDALTLEKIIIYKIGRKILNEGDLLNFAPGGNWAPGEHIFYLSPIDTNYNLESLDFVAKEKFKSIKKSSKLIFLNEIKNKYKIYTYKENGELISIDSIICFFKDNHNIELFFKLKYETLPIYELGYIFSKKPLKDFYISENLTFIKSFLLDFNFLKKLDEKIINCENFTLKLKNKNSTKIKIKYKNEILRAVTFNTNNKRISIKKSKKGKNFGKWYEFYENGVLKEISEYYENGNLSKSETYDINGIINYKMELFLNGTFKKRWYYFSNGNLNSFCEHSENGKTRRKIYYFNGKIKCFYSNFNNLPLMYSYYNNKGDLLEKFIEKKGFLNYNLKGDIIGIYNERQMEFKEHFNILFLQKKDIKKTKNDKFSGTLSLFNDL